MVQALVSTLLPSVYMPEKVASSCIIRRVAALMGAEENNNNSEGNPQTRPPTSNPNLPQTMQVKKTAQKQRSHRPSNMRRPPISNRMGRLLLTLFKHSQLLSVRKLGLWLFVLSVLRGSTHGRILIQEFSRFWDFHCGGHFILNTDHV